MDTYITAEQIKSALANTPQITFEVTDACNLRCEYCAYGKLYADYDKREDKILPTKTAKLFIDYMAALWASPENQFDTQQFVCQLLWRRASAQYAFH